MAFPFFNRNTPPPSPQQRTEALLVALQKGGLVDFAKKHPLTPADFLFFYDTFEGKVVTPNRTPLHTAAIRGALHQVREALALSNERLSLENFLVKNRVGRTPLHAAAWGGHIDQVAEVLKPSGQKLTAEAFLVGQDSGKTPLDYAIQEGHLDQVFAPSIWVGRVGEMVKLWEHVPEAHRKQIDYNATINAAIRAGYPAASHWNAQTFAGAIRASAAQWEQGGFPQGKAVGS